MSAESFMSLTNWLKECPDYRKPVSRLYYWDQNRRGNSTPFSCAVLCGVLYLTGKNSIRPGSLELRIPSSSYYLLSQYVVEELVARSHEVITFPPKEEQVFMYMTVVNRPFPGAIFAIDGTMVNLLYKGKDNTNFSRKGAAQLNVQILCDYRRNIVFIDSNYNGKAFDSIAFSHSPAWNMIQNTGMLREGGFVLADEGYALDGRIMRPYDKRSQDPSHKLFRELHKSARLHIENAIGDFKRRCPWLEKGMHASTPLKMTSTILAAAVVHQYALFCEKRENGIPKDYLNQPFDIPPEFYNKRSYALRQEITNYFIRSYPQLYEAIINNTYIPSYI